MITWISMDEREPELQRSVIFGYFGENERLRGYKAIGYRFQWVGMPTPLITGWNWEEYPTHWLEFPNDPS